MRPYGTWTVYKVKELRF